MWLITMRVKTKKIMMRVDEGGGKDYEEAFDGRGQGELARGSPGR